MGQLSPTELRPGAQDHTCKMGTWPWGKVSPPKDSTVHSVHSWAPYSPPRGGWFFGMHGEGLDSILFSMLQSSPCFWGRISAQGLPPAGEQVQHVTRPQRHPGPLCIAVSVAYVCPSAPTTDFLWQGRTECAGYKWAPCLTASHPTEGQGEWNRSLSPFPIHLFFFQGRDTWFRA